MHSYRALVLGGMVAALALTAGRGQDAKGVAKEVLDLAREAEADKDVAKKAAALKKRFPDVRQAMRLYNVRRRGGVGLGEKGVGIERRFVTLGEDGITADALKKEAADLTRAAHVTLVLAEVTRGFAPDKEVLGRGKKEWLRDVDALAAGSRSLLKAVKANDAEAAKAAAAQINNACNSCHDWAK
jgi:hypothetical protein